MILRTVFFSCAVLFTCSLSTYAQTEQDLTWYLHFFDRSISMDVSQQLAENEQELAEALEINDLAAQARIWKEQGMLHLTRTYSYGKALDYFFKALTLEDSLHLDYERAITYLAMASAYEQVNYSERSVESLKQAQEFQEKIEDLTLQTYVLNKYGQMLIAQGNLALALEQFELVLELLKDLNKPSLRAETLTNIASVYGLQGKLEQALEYNKEALTLRRSVKDRKKEAESLTHIGELYRLMKNSERSLANHVAALEVRQTLDDKAGIAQSYNNAAILYQEQNNMPRAIANLELALAAGNEANATYEKMRSYENLVVCYKKLGDYKSALNYKEQYEGMFDLIQREKDDRELAEKQSLHEISKLEVSINRLEEVRRQREREIEAQKKFRNILMLVIVLIATVLSLTVFLYLSKRRSNKQLKASNAIIQSQNLQLKELNATKDKFFSIISHDVKGPLNSLTSFASLLINHTDKLSKEDIQMLAKDLDKSLKNLFALLENLLEWSRSQTGNIEFTAEPFDLTAVLTENKTLLETQAANKKIQLIQEFTTPFPIKAHRHSITTVVRNLVSNAIKFTPEGGTITLSIQPDAKDVTVSIRDTGVGMSAEVIEKLFRIDTKHSTKGTADEKGTGLGLILCKDFIEKNGGRMSVISEINKGSTFYFTLPL